MSAASETGLRDEEVVLGLEPGGVRRLIDALATFVAILDPSGRIREVDRRALDAGGLERSEVEGRLFWETRWWSHDAAARKALRAAVGAAREGRTTSWDTTARLGDDCRMDVAVKVHPLREADGAITAIVVSGVDIDARMSAERAVATERERLRGLLDLVPALLSLHEGPDHVYVAANENHRLYVGDRDLIGCPVREVAADLGHAGIVGRFDAAFRDGTPFDAGEVPVTRIGPGRAEGAEGYYRWTIRPWRDGQGAIRGVVSFALDISDLVAAREEAERSGAILRLALEKSGAGAWSSDPVSRRITIDDGTARLLGLDPGRPLTLEDTDARIHPDDLPGLLKERARADVDGHFDCEFRIATEGETRWLRVLGEVAMDDDGHPSQAIGLNIDITAQKAREARLYELLREVNHRGKNMLAIVEAFARQAFRGGLDRDTNHRRFTARIAGLAATQDQLVSEDWSSVDLGRLAHAQIAAARARGAFEISDEAVRIRSDRCHQLGMAFMELALNALEHGAWRDGAGQVALSWWQADGKLYLTWVERSPGGAATPTRSGFGRAMTERSIAHALGGEAGASFTDDGLEWRLVVPLDDIVAF